MRIRLCPPEEFSTQGLPAQGAPATRVKINPEYIMYSQDLPDGELYFPTLKDYDRLYGWWVFLFARSNTKSVSLILNF
jgi:hypothetical protein